MTLPLPKTNPYPDYLNYHPFYTQQKQMRMPIGQLHLLHKRRINLRKLNLLLRRHSNHLHAPPQHKLLNPGRNPIRDYHRIRIKRSSRNPSIELPSAVLDPADDVDDWVGVVVFEFCDHVAQREVLFVDVVDFYEFGEFAAGEEEVVGLPELLAGGWLGLFCELGLLEVVSGWAWWRGLLLLRLLALLLVYGVVLFDLLVAVGWGLLLHALYF